MTNPISPENLQHIPIHAFGYELLRGQLLPDLMGKELSKILYWAGKNIARRYPLATFEEITDFFEKAGWGSITITDEKRREMTVELTGALIKERFRTKQESTYQMEAGFLAQQIQQQRNMITEAHEEQKKRSDKIIFTIQWDPKDILED